MENVVISKISTSGNQICWLTVRVEGEFPYPALVRSSKTAEDYTIGQAIKVPTGALRPIGTAPAAPAVPA